MDLYRILGVKRSASQAQIKAAFRALALKLHPDRLSSNSQGSSKSEVKSKVEAFRQVTAAYEVLGDPEKRIEYNNSQYGMAGRPFSSQRYTSQGPLRRHSQTNGTEFHPGAGGRHARGETGWKGPVSPEHFNMGAWEDAHYGDSSQQNVPVGDRERAAAAAAPPPKDGKSGSAWFNMGPKSHQAYFRRRHAAAQEAARRASEGAETATAAQSMGYKERPGASGPAQAYAAYAASAQRAAKGAHTAATENLHRQRAERRNRTPKAKKGQEGDSAGVNDQCVLS